MSKIILIVAALALAGCQHGYFRLSEAPRSGATRAEWAAITGAVNHQLNK